MKAKIALPIVLVLLVVVVLCQRGGEPPLAPDPMAQWVCDNCGKTRVAPQGDTSIDCPHCDQGQMVQRVYFRCAKCGETFEAYQMNRSPRSPRAADVRKEADVHSEAECGAQEDDKAPVEHPADAALVRRPDGSWIWECTDGGVLIMHHPRCPKCGELPPGQFTKVLSPPSK